MEGNNSNQALFLLDITIMKEPQLKLTKSQSKRVSSKNLYPSNLSSKNRKSLQMSSLSIVCFKPDLQPLSKESSYQLGILLKNRFETMENLQIPRRKASQDFQL